ncbi:MULTISPECIES: hypothetical protein [unclassified Bradyrhizobium]|uniref:hypothetical protein n=1 Tax=unclassified Bradyrhizobium TaxID=2631580 RepID=UPI0012E3B304|nr:MULTISPECIES: hypothetical protein [unclassified Bradyrhizobium]
MTSNEFLPISMAIPSIAQLDFRRRAMRRLAHRHRTSAHVNYRNRERPCRQSGSAWKKNPGSRWPKPQILLSDVDFGFLDDGRPSLDLIVQINSVFIGRTRHDIETEPRKAFAKRFIERPLGKPHGQPCSDFPHWKCTGVITPNLHYSA